MSDQSVSAQLPEPEDQELTPEQLAQVSGGTQEEQTPPLNRTIDVKVDYDTVGAPPPGSQTPEQDTPNRIQIRIP